MKAHIEVVTTDSVEGSPSLLLFFDSKRYLINVGEGVQRACTEYKTRLAKLDTVFVTGRLSWEAVGGMPGMLLTVADMGLRHMRVVGPSGIEGFIDALASFARRDTLPLSVVDIASPPNNNENHSSYLPVVFTDDNVSVHAIAYNVHFASHSKSSSPSHSPPNKRPRTHNLNDAITPSSSSLSSSSLATAVSYVFRTAPTPGKFNPRKAKALGLQPGPDYGKLVRGETVTTSEGRIIHPSDVMSEGSPGQQAVIIDVRHGDVDALVEHPAWKELLSSSSSSSSSRAPLVLVAHLTPQHILLSDKYQAFVSRFPASTQQWAMNPVLCSNTPLFPSAMQHLHRLRSVCPTAFSGIHFKSQHRFPASSLPSFLHCPSRGVRCILSPASAAGRVETGREGDPGADSDPEGDGEHGRPIRDDGVVFLGTGSAIPSKYRNVSSIIVEMADDSYVLLDCGEGTCGQLVRRYGVEGYRTVLARTPVVWISHMHADHHCGLLRVMQHRATVTSQPVLVVGPRDLGTFLEAYFTASPAEHVPYRFRYVGDGDTAPAMCDAVPRLSGTVFVAAIHCRDSWSIVMDIEGHQGDRERRWRLLYSADTRPNKALRRAASGATLFIHEATFESSMQREAEAKRHATWEEAVEEGKASRADTIVLTHFSQRYAKGAGTEAEDEDGGEGRIITAFDMMRVPVSARREIANCQKELESLFEEETVGGGDGDHGLVVQM